MAGPVIGVDIGGTAIKAGVVDRDGKVSSVLRIPTRPSGGREGIAAAATEVIQAVLAAAQQRGIQPGGLGIASAGVIDVINGSVFAATENLPGWTGFNL